MTSSTSSTENAVKIESEGKLTTNSEGRAPYTKEIVFLKKKCFSSKSASFLKYRQFVITTRGTIGWLGLCSDVSKVGK